MMKKYIFVLGAFVTMVSLSACSTKTEQTEATETGEVLKEAAYGEEGIANSEYIDRAQEVAAELDETSAEKAVENAIEYDDNASVVPEKAVM